MTMKRFIQPQLIARHWDLNPREKDDAHVEAIAHHMNANGYDPDFPIIVYDVNGILTAATGHHRLEAALLESPEYPNLPLSEVYCEIREGDMDAVIRTMMTDNFQWSPSSNAKIGKMPTRQEIRQMRYRLMLFPDNFEKSDRTLAELWNCHHQTVSNLRKDIIADLREGTHQQIPHFSKTARRKILAIITKDVYTGQDGKGYTRAANIVEKPDPEVEKQQAVDTLLQLAMYIRDSVAEFCYDKQNLDIEYCQRRLYTLIGLHVGDDVNDWDREKIYQQIQIAEKLEETLAETPDNDPVTQLLREFAKLNEVVETYSVFNEYSQPFLSESLQTASENLQRVWTADWESKPRVARLRDLDQLLMQFAILQTEEDAARAEAETAETQAQHAQVEQMRQDVKIQHATNQLETARNDLDTASEALYTAWQTAECIDEYDDFLAAAADVFSVDYYELRDVVDYENKIENGGDGEASETHHRLPTATALQSPPFSHGAQKFRFELSLKALNLWESRVLAITEAVKQNAEWVKPLLASQETDASDTTETPEPEPVTDIPIVNPTMESEPVSKTLVGISLYYADTTTNKPYNRSMVLFSDAESADRTLSEVPADVRETLQRLLNA